MNDLISRSSALRILWRKIKDVARNKDGTYKLRDGAFVDGLFRAVDVISHIEPAVRWIPVSERLPEEKMEVLVCNDEGKIGTAFIKTVEWHPGVRVPEWRIKYCMYDDDYWNELENGSVIAWMPLPDPYQEAEHE
ncbi:MAG: DUF551 domain-containing protein [Aeriscardovia sp.]|nr:DUF551 domain-containing protein [Aeriscardovia sp.]